MTLSLKPEEDVEIELPSRTKVMITRSSADNSVHFVRPLKKEEL